MNEHEEHIKSGQSYKCDCKICQDLQMGQYNPDKKRLSFTAYLSSALTESGRYNTSVGHKKPHYSPAQ